MTIRRNHDELGSDETAFPIPDDGSFSNTDQGSLGAQEERHALVIGNKAYLHPRPLDNPANDAAAIAASLKEVGFDVTLRNDTDLKDLKGAVREFVQKLPKGAVALVFFAGHGV